MDSMDTFHQQAMTILTSNATRRVFEMQCDDDKVRERYGRNIVGQRCLWLGG
jgi:hypothetical protein